jgi:hypothetical protein
LDGFANVWDLREGCQLYTIRGHGGSPTLGLDFSPTGEYFATAGHDKLVHTWKTNFAEKLSSVTAAAAAASMPMPSPPARGSRNLSRLKTSSSKASAAGKLPDAPQLQPQNVNIHVPAQPPVLPPSQNIPEELGSTLHQIVSQLDLISRSLSIFEERLTLSESKVRFKRISHTLLSAFGYYSE